MGRRKGKAAWTAALDPPGSTSRRPGRPLMCGCYAAAGAALPIQQQIPRRRTPRNDSLKVRGLCPPKGGRYEGKSRSFGTVPKRPMPQDDGEEERQGGKFPEAASDAGQKYSISWETRSRPRTFSDSARTAARDCSRWLASEEMLTMPTWERCQVS